MWPFKKKSKQEIKIETRIKMYGDTDEDFILFAGMADEEIQKKERIWLSLQLATKVVDGEISKGEVACRIEEQAKVAIMEELKKRYNA